MLLCFGYFLTSYLIFFCRVAIIFREFDFFCVRDVGEERIPSTDQRKIPYDFNIILKKLFYCEDLVLFTIFIAFQNYFEN